MRLFLPAATLLAFCLACGGGSNIASTVTTSIPADLAREPDGTWPATPEGVCARLSECGCSPVPSFKACVAQQKLAEKTIHGVIGLQGQIVDMAMEGEDGPEAQLVKEMTAFGGQIVAGGMDASYAAMVGSECDTLCAEIARAAAEAD